MKANQLSSNNPLAEKSKLTWGGIALIGLVVMLSGAQAFAVGVARNDYLNFDSNSESGTFGISLAGNDDNQAGDVYGPLSPQTDEFGTLTIDAIGLASFTPTNSVPGVGLAVFSYTISNPDGEESTANLYVEGISGSSGDPDGDTLSTEFEVLDYSTDPLIFDTDGDGLSDGDEIAPTDGIAVVTDPNLADTDNDGLNDFQEQYVNLTDPLAFNDADSDGLGDGQEEALGTDVNNPDTDGDEVNDAADAFPLDADWQTFQPLIAADVPVELVGFNRGALDNPTIRLNTSTGETYRFSQDGTGLLLNNGGSTAFTWVTDSDGRIQISFINNASDERTSFLYVSNLGLIATQEAIDNFISQFGNQQIEFRIAIASQELSLLADNAPDAPDSYYWLKSTSSYLVVDSVYREALFGAGAQWVDAPVAAGSAREFVDLQLRTALPIVSNALPFDGIDQAMIANLDPSAANTFSRLSAEIAVFEPDGTGVLSISGDTFSWEVPSTDPLAMDLTLESGPGVGAVLTYRKYEVYDGEVGTGQSLLYLTAVLGEESYSIWVYSNPDVLQGNGTADAISPFIGSFLNSDFGLSNPDAYEADDPGILKFTDFFGYRLNSDQTATRVWDASPTGEGPTGSDSWLWSIENGAVVLEARRLVDNDGNALSYYCVDATDPNCEIWRTRTWRMLEVDPDLGRLYVIESEEGWINIAPRIKFYQKEVQDRDGDGESDIDEVFGGADPYSFNDSDGDGLGDGQELALGTNPNNADSDEDGLSDSDETNVHLTDPNNTDTDDDGLGDYAEILVYGADPVNPDTDGDGLSDGVEVNERGTSPTNVDSDGDSLSDGVEVNDLGTSPTNFDSDGDGLDDGYEVNDYPSDPTVFDTDGDGLSDGVENNLGSNPTVADSDGDGLSDGDEVNHFGTSPTQTDSDFDGLSDYAEVNGGGLTGEDVANINGYVSDPNKVDSDYDGVFDAHEAELGTNPSNSDTDGDGLTDADELLYQLDPLNPDVDGDGLPDGAEISAGSNPNVFDTDGDGLNDRQEVIEFGTNPLEADSDFDGVTDDFEVFNSGTDPLTPNPDEDADNDGVRNADDAFPENGGESGDLDGDGVGNNQDDDIDGDGVLNGDDAYALDASRRGDSDQNGLDDTWELQYFNGLGVAKDFDEEGDGLNNLQEYLSGTHPFEPNISQVLLRERDIPLNHAGRSGSVGLGYEVRNEDGLSTNAGAFLPGLNLRVHFNSAEVDSFVIDTSNALYTYGLFGINNVWTVDDENLDGDFATTHYVTITWLDIYGEWPEAYVLEQDTAELLRLNFVTRAGLHEEAVPSVTIKFSPVDMAEGVGLDTRNGDSFGLSHEDISVPLLTRGPLDIDADGEVKTFTDGLLIVRRIFLQDPNGADSRFVGANGSFQDLADVNARLNLRYDLPGLLDIDGDGSISGPTDGILLLRRMLGFEGGWLTYNAVGEAATRSNPSDIADYIDSLMEDLPEAPKLAK